MAAAPAAVAATNPAPYGMEPWVIVGPSSTTSTRLSQMTEGSTTRTGEAAWITSAFGVGAIGGGLALGVWGGSGSRVRTALASILGLGAATFALGAAPASLLPVAVCAMFAVGAFSAVANGCIAAILQATIAPEYQGRVFTLMMSLAGAMCPIGLLLATPLADALGVRAWYLAGGLVCAAMGATAFLVRPIVRIESIATAG